MYFFLSFTSTNFRLIGRFYLGGDSSPSNTRVKCWIAECKIGQTSTNDKPHNGCPVEMTTPEKNLTNP